MPVINIKKSKNDLTSFIVRPSFNTIWRNGFIVKTANANKKANAIANLAPLPSGMFLFLPKYPSRSAMNNEFHITMKAIVADHLTGTPPCN